jgi:periplasmic protein TonB
MAKAIPLYRCTTFGISCLLHVALVGGAIALGRDLVTPKVPAVLIADLTLVEAPRPLEEPKAGPPAPPLRKPEKLTLPKPIATPMPAPVAEPQTVETRIPTPPAPAAEPSPQPREPVGGSASSTSLEAAGETSSVQLEPGAGNANTGAAAPQQSAVARPSDAITSMAMPRGGYQLRPSYPTSARRLGIQGMTTLRVYVAADGRVSEVLVHESAGHPDLDSAAAEAVKRWRFEPARRGTEAVGVWVLLPVEFRLR